MDTNEHESLGLRSSQPWKQRTVEADCFNDSLLHGKLVYDIVGAAFEVLKELGHGIHEKPYENALIHELALRKHQVNQQRRFEIQYKGQLIGEFVPDIIVDDAVIIDTKVIDAITGHERGQMLNYLRITKLRVGLIINFHRPRLQWERVIL